MGEMLCVVDEHDEFIRVEEREVVHNSKLWHRGVHVFLFNEDGEMLVQRRSPRKDKFPNKIDISISEHVTVGETYVEAAVRGLLEELRVAAPIDEILYFRAVYGPNDHMVCRIYDCHYHGEITPNEEITEISFVTEEHLKAILKENPDEFTPWFQQHLRWRFGLSHDLHPLP